MAGWEGRTRGESGKEMLETYLKRTGKKMLETRKFRGKEKAVRPSSMHFIAFSKYVPYAVVDCVCHRTTRQ
jgi:hypothetical protein